MRRFVHSALVAGLVLTGAATASADERDFCPDRPGNGTPACVLDKGRVQLEVGLFDGSYSHQAGTTENTYAVGSTELRVGVAETTEVQLSWTPYTTSRQRDRATGSAVRMDGTGDVTVALRQSLRNPDGGGFAVAIQPFVTAPSGDRKIGGGAWQGGIIMPVSVALSQDVSVGLSPEIDILPDMDGHGSHLGWSGTAGIGVAWDNVTAGAELSLSIDDDPAGHQTMASVNVTTAWTPAFAHDVQFDVAVYIGLTHDTPDAEIVAGIAHRF